MDVRQEISPQTRAGMVIQAGIVSKLRLEVFVRLTCLVILRNLASSCDAFVDEGTESSLSFPVDVAHSVSRNTIHRIAR